MSNAQLRTTCNSGEIPARSEEKTIGAGGSRLISGDLRAGDAAMRLCAMCLNRANTWLRVFRAVERSYVSTGS